MEPGVLRDALTLAAGVATGVFSGAFGVGGATISTPAIRALGLPALLAVGTTLPSILPSAVSGTARYAREQLVDWGVVGWAAPTGIVAAVGGSLLSRVVPGEGHLLMVCTALLLGFAAWRVRPGPPRRDDERPSSVDGAAPPPGSPAPVARRDHPAVVASVGAAAGLLSGLLGLGGGIVLVPGFTEIVRMPLKAAIATSLACVGIFAIPGTVTHSLIGGIDWRFALLLAVGVVPGARLGAAAAIRASDRRLRTVVSAFLGVVATAYFLSETGALVS